MRAWRALKRITINIYESDYEWLTSYYGSYQEQIRHIIAMYVIEQRRKNGEYDRRTDE